MTFINPRGTSLQPKTYHRLYIKCALDFPGKKANLRLALLTICSQYETEWSRTLHLRVLPDIKKSLTIFFPFSGPKSANVDRIPEADFSWH